MGSNDQSHQIVKGKRTKRQRSSSPFGFAVTDSSSSGSSCGREGGGVGGGGERGAVVDDYNSTSSPTTSGEIYESTEEEEDMANCLIMLAQGDAPRQIQDHKIEKFNSRKFAEIVTSTNKAGFYVYECKTCNRSFPSFQALGGHRASHKKPKALATESEKKSSSVSVLPLKDADSEEKQKQFNKNSPPHPLSVQAMGNINSKANKIHECSICGSEFTSGQALGGHMRRHRAAASAATGNQVAAAMSIDDTSNNNNIDQSNSDEVKPAARNILPLDLNLPAPEDDLNLRDSNKFQFGSKQQALVFSAPALVDCHY